MNIGDLQVNDIIIYDKDNREVFIVNEINDSSIYCINIFSKKSGTFYNWFLTNKTCGFVKASKAEENYYRKLMVFS